MNLRWGSALIGLIAPPKKKPLAPALGGIEAGQRLRLLSIPPSWIVSLSAYTEGDLKLRFPELCFDGFLNKPLESERLLFLLRRLPGLGTEAPEA